MAERAASALHSTPGLHREESVMAARQNASLEFPRVANPTEQVVDDDVVSESESQSELYSDSEDESGFEHRHLREEQPGEGGIEVREGAMKTLEVGPSAGLRLISHREGSQANSLLLEESKGRGRMTYQELLASVTAQAVLQSPAKNQLQTPVHLTSVELSPIYVNQSFTSVSCSSVCDQNLSSGTNSRSLCSADLDMQGSNEKPVKTSVSDGYNWRKYGQKQVKSPKGSRSYFRCTYSGCSAKKIECCDHVGHVLEIVSRSHHNHDPPRKVNSPRESRIVRSVRPSIDHNVSEQSVRDLSGTQTSTSSKEPARETPIIPHRIQRISNGYNGDCETPTRKEDANNKEPKRSGKKNSISGPDPLLRPAKKPKLVVHSEGDMGISADGYRWRKYGQKMVKGNPHPRNYYRCTSAGCPVRKHTETAADNASVGIITYKGVHDHDMAVPKKRHGPPLVAAAAAAMNSSSSQTKKVDSNSTTKWSVDTEGELTGEALELGGEKAMESARALLSIGFEIKPPC